MKKCAFVIPYFGKFNNYFQFFLNSCAINEDWDWLIFTDDKREFNYPPNVYVHYTTFEEIKTLFENKLEFGIVLDTPHKLCDFKPTYGFMFEEYLKDYMSWGHCDNDLLWGKIDDFITDEMLKKYDKLFTQGHCVIYKNTAENNKRFMLPLNNNLLYKEVFTSPKGYAFDEEYLTKNINRIYKEHGFLIYQDDLSANIARKYSDFRLVRYEPTLGDYIIEEKSKCVYIWDKDNGVSRYYKGFRELKSANFLYIHLQGRKMNISPNVDLNSKTIKISANVFDCLEVDKISLENVNKIKNQYLNNHRLLIIKSDFKILIKRIKNKLNDMKK